MDWKRRRFVITILVILVLTLIYLWQRLEVVRLGYDIGKLQSEKEVFLNNNREARMQLIGLQSLKRVETIAREKLGFVVADRIVQVEGDSAAEKNK